MAERQTTNDRNRPAPLAPSDFGASPRRVRRRAATGELHVCPGCDSSLVYPVDWAPADAKRWTVDLRCPECEWQGGGVYGQDVVDRFDDELDRGTEQLLTDLGMLARANMEDQVDHFVTALNAGWILPEDF